MGFSDGRKITGLYGGEVLRREQVSPHMVRITMRGPDIGRLPVRGFDQWFRLFLPNPSGETDFARVPEGFGLASYVRYLTTKSGVRPPFRNYTVREHRPSECELDVDFVIHGDRGVAGMWAQRAEPGEPVAMIDQGRGFDPVEAGTPLLLAGDESALPAIAGILRDLDRAATGLAVIEVPSLEDRQPLDAPPGVEVCYLERTAAGARPGTLALDTVAARSIVDAQRLQVYLAGEQSLVAAARRHLVAAGVPKAHVTFTGYWKAERR